MYAPVRAAIRPMKTKTNPRSLGDSRPSGLLPARQVLICVIVAVGLFEALWFGVVTDTGLAAVDPSITSWMVAHRRSARLRAPMSPR